MKLISFIALYCLSLCAYASPKVVSAGASITEILLRLEANLGHRPGLEVARALDRDVFPLNSSLLLLDWSSTAAAWSSGS